MFLDPNHDHLTAVEFRVSAAGVQRDVYVYNDVTEDPSWDAVGAPRWRRRRGLDRGDADPLLAAAFPRTDQPTWGINAERVIFRKHEWSWLALVPRNESGLASRDGAPRRAADLARPGIWSCVRT